MVQYETIISRTALPKEEKGSVQTKIYEEFNSLSVVYREPGSKFFADLCCNTRFFLDPVCLELANALALIFLRWGKGGRLDSRAGGLIYMRDFPRCQEVLKSWASIGMIWAKNEQHLG